MYNARSGETGSEFQTLKNHLSGVSELCEKFAREINLPKTGALLGAVHDLGKYNDLFQQRLADNSVKVNHMSPGALFIDSMIPNTLVSQLMTLSVLSHHGGLLDCVGENGSSPFFESFTEPEGTKQKELVARFRGEIPFSNKKAEEAFSELKSKCEYLLKINAGQKKNALMEISLLEKFLFSCLVDADRLDSIYAFKTEKYIEKNCDFENLNGALDSYISSFKPNKLSKVRNIIYESCSKAAKSDRGVYKLCVKTGGGKTFASLKFALEHILHNQNSGRPMKRVIYVLPYLSIIEQNAESVCKAFEFSDMRDVVLESHSNVKGDEKSDRTKPRLPYIPTDNYNSPIIFTTMVQFLENVYSGGTQGIRRFHNYANSVIVFDEIQALPIKCVYLFNSLVNFLTDICGSTVLLCTATHPRLDKIYSQSENGNAIAIKKIINIDTGTFEELNRCDIRDLTVGGDYVVGLGDEEIARKISDFSNNYASILTIVNTKASADKLFGFLKADKNYELFYLSTNMCAQHRLDTIKKIKKLLEKKRKLICVSTQLIEAGVDLDFECVVRYAAGADNIVQAAGRCNREGNMTDKDGKPKKGDVFVVRARDENLNKLKDISDAKQKYAESYAACENKKIDSAEFLEDYFERYYRRKETEMAYILDRNRVNYDVSEIELLTDNVQRCSKNKNPRVRLTQSFRTAGENFSVISNNQVGVVVPYGDGKEITDNFLSSKPNFSLLKNAQRFTVNVFLNMLGKLPVKQIGDKEIYVWAGVYDEKRGALFDENSAALFTK